MTYTQVRKKSKQYVMPNCKACPICDGRACGNKMPGPGSKGTGEGAYRNYCGWQKILINLDTIYSSKEKINTECSLFGKNFAIPVFAGPVGSVQMHYGQLYSDVEYNRILLRACAQGGSAAFTGDGPNSEVMEDAGPAIAAVNGCGVPTIKPWNLDGIKKKIALVKDAHPFAMAMDIDGAGLPFLKNFMPPAGSKSVEELKQIVQAAQGVPFIIKGIMTVEGALKAEQAGAAAIVVSNHGGRVLDSCPSTAEVLPEIANAIAGRIPVLVDGGIRTGVDVFKALALGASAVIIARPFVNAVFGGGEEGVKIYLKQLATELEDTMRMTGATKLSEITSDKLR